MAIDSKIGGRNGEDDDLHEPLLNGKLDESAQEENVTPFSTAGFLSQATVAWINPLLALGFRKHLDMKDVPLLAPQDRAKEVYKTFKRHWENVQEEQLGPPSISIAVVRSFWKQITLIGFISMVNAVASYVGPYLINDFVEFLGGRRRFQREGYVLVLCVFVANMVDTLTQRQWWLGGYRLNFQVRGSLTAIVFNKGLCLSSESRKNHTAGEIINYMAVDLARVAEFSWWVHDVWLLPLQVGLALAILYKVVGIAAVAALLATIATILLNAPLVQLQRKYQEKLMAAKDARMKATSECLRSMRILKLQAWETKYLAKIEGLRAAEYGWLAKDLYMIAASTFLLWTAPILVSMATFGTCALLGVPLTAGRVLSAVATFRVLREPLRNFPDLASMLAQTKVSLHRLRHYLQEPELPPGAVERGGDPAHHAMAIEIDDGVFSWEAPTAECAPTLCGVNLRVHTGARVAVCGSVGSGKSSLLACMLGEIPKLKGRVKVKGRTAYVAQTAWIQSGTIEDNIRFGSLMNRSLYERVLQACDLNKDIALFSFGDQTEIGERGVNLSGGQKQRIQLARALYQEADVYFLDDPFSAVDAHTGSYLLRECIMGALQSKTVVYVTHQMEFLPIADLILVLRDGEIVQAGKYHDLFHAGTDFSTLVSAHNDAIDIMHLNSDTRRGADADASDAAYDSQGDPQRQSNGGGGPQEHGGNIQTHPNNAHKNVESAPEKVRLRQLVKEEEREKGRVSYRVYWAYVTAVAGGAFVPVFILAQISFQVLQILSNYWMAWATPAAAGGAAKVSSRTLIAVYSALAISGSAFVMLRALTVSIVGLMTAQKYFVKMLRAVFRAPMSFFDCTPAGRILNRGFTNGAMSLTESILSHREGWHADQMSADQSSMDLEIQFAMSRVVNGFLQLLGILVLLSQVTWQVLLLVCPIAGACFLLQRYYMASARELARLYSTQKSPIINHYAESITGAATIRGFRQQARFMEANLENFDKYATTYFHNTAAREWLILRMEVLSVLASTLCLLLVVALPRELINPSLAGLAITYGLNLNSMLSRLVWNVCALENTAICVERILQYCTLASEAPLVVDSSRPARDWPANGTIDIHNLQVRYNAHTPMVLHGVSCTIKGGRRVGIVGRTGSGKSTFIQALFRMVEPVSGSIVIDHVDISTIGLHDLRSRLSIIPQDPTLFEGDVRINLDPLGQHSDVEIWEALDKCQLGDIVRAKEGKLNSPVTENGENWSVGQRQLVCLGRALLKRTRILVLDEATASIDSATDGLIQCTLRAEFSSCTVITVAHRIPTVIDSHDVLVLENGTIVEYNTPTTLLEDGSSFFSQLVAEYSNRSTNRVSDL